MMQCQARRREEPGPALCTSPLLKSSHLVMQTSNAICSVICLCRTLFDTSFGILGQKSIEIWFHILSNIFGRCKKIDLRFAILDHYFNSLNFAWLQMPFAQSSAYVERFLTPFFKTLDKNLFKYDFWFCPTFLEGAKKLILKKCFF